jgi:adenine/guanine phosphoribosyltransferase-like PRPP-binding protein
VDDIIRSGKAIDETVALVRELGAPVIGCGTIVRFKDAPANLGEDVPIKSLVEFESTFYDEGEECLDCKRNAPVEHVRF